MFQLRTRQMDQLPDFKWRVLRHVPCCMGNEIQNTRRRRWKIVCLQFSHTFYIIAYSKNQGPSDNMFEIVSHQQPAKIYVRL